MWPQMADNIRRQTIYWNYHVVMCTMHSENLCFLLNFSQFFHYPVVFEIKLFSSFSENLSQFFSKIRFALIRKFGIKKRCIYQIIGIKKCKKISSWKWNKSILGQCLLKLYIFKKLAVKTIRILEITRGKSCNSRTNYEKTRVLMISTKY